MQVHLLTPKKKHRVRPSNWRVPKSKSFVQGRGKGVERVRRENDSRDVQVSESESDDSEDDDYVLSDDDEDDEHVSDLDFIEDEDDNVLDDVEELREKKFEDYLDGSHKLDKLYKNGKIWAGVEFGSIVLEPWLIFENKAQFLEVFRDFCIQEGFAVTVDRADSWRYTARCVVETCNWRIHATVLVDNVNWAIKTLTGEHNTCGRLEDNPMVSTEWLCRHLLQDLEANPEIPVESLQKICVERFRLNVKKRLFYKVKAVSRVQMHGGFAESYALLPRYAEIIKATNPGSYAIITWTANTGNQAPQFKACFFSFAASVKGFLGGCRPIIGMD
ncbi:uncharacterized protein LOC110714338 [Chenopodium quinoa]|uniref:uncharacterized protein LOC110714338 n=1 Tax=Chenopodium quinoa TaxID=63459 RepID=UPI000B777420|nr:uncharacterized protein LOC110714338 [Chenopodium quinoa]